MTRIDLDRSAVASDRRTAEWLGCGLGLRREHHDAVLRERQRVGFFELISENFMIEGGKPLQVLERVRAVYPVALHGVSASLGSAEPLDALYLGRLARLVERVDPVIVSDHLCWSRIGGHSSHDLLPLPFTAESVQVTSANIRRVQDRLGRRILVENVSTYLRFSGSSLTEWEFVAAVAEEADCGILLDLNNVYVNARNHGFEPTTYLAALPPSRIGQYHLGGHQDHGDHVLDTHDHPIVGTVWDLYRAAVRRFGPRPTIIERDGDIPPLETLLAETHLAEEVLDASLAVA
ncbi:MAG TPA: DUF692 domain-containing protein [Candidatus Polarisedimenticolia bacterium]|nr:DUF692 domain-containing protein [Candidatus Polarisedimenticolia bacterium]